MMKDKRKLLLILSIMIQMLIANSRMTISLEKSEKMTRHEKIKALSEYTSKEIEEGLVLHQELLASKFKKTPAPSLIEDTNAVRIAYLLINDANVQYYGSVSLGTPPQHFNVLFDSGSDLLWLPLSSCSQCHLGSGNRYSIDTSTTAVTNHSSVKIKYVKGFASGYYVQDYFNFLPTSNRFMFNFMAANYETDVTTLRPDGILGLTNDVKIQTIVDLGYNNGIFEENVFGFYLNKTHTIRQPDLSGNSTLTVGFVPDEFKDSMNWFPVSRPDYWSIYVYGVSINGVEASLSGYEDGVVDSGTSLLVVPQSVFDMFIDQFPANSVSKQLTGTLVKCGDGVDLNTYPVITFLLGGIKINITPKEYLIHEGYPVCELAVIGDTQQGIFLLGDTFMRDTYVGYNKKTQEVGFSRHNGYLTEIDDTIKYWTGVLGTLLLICLIYVMITSPKRIKTRVGVREPLIGDSSQNMNRRIEAA